MQIQGIVLWSCALVWCEEVLRCLTSRLITCDRYGQPRVEVSRVNQLVNAVKLRIINLVRLRAYGSNPDAQN